MDSVPAPAPSVGGQDEWDADGFEIPSLKIGKSASGKKESNGVASFPKVIRGTEKIYLGPHGAPPSQLKHQEVNSFTRNQRLKQKLKEAEKKGTSTGQENKVEVLRDLIGSKPSTANLKGGENDWLDPHCHERQFQRSI